MGQGKNPLNPYCDMKKDEWVENEPTIDELMAVREEKPIFYGLENAGGADDADGNYRLVQREKATDEIIECDRKPSRKKKIADFLPRCPIQAKKEENDDERITRLLAEEAQYQAVVRISTLEDKRLEEAKASQREASTTPPR